ncbi:MAG: class I SAM-dependent methyltransferase [Anaerolineae bacterium]|jgi:ubiquinone/menaquinone biosynthesis C-methylase UbiE|nr:class I SAM-dependent methyltransferase [Anaerolineae bacterium]MBT3712824.1 class I SAM-dependent methyltransferase [Anaerolineae bacterium]MBT4310722.1 class I SAM-dependent methyltransferase [Anaerolineae bacterium]MBT4841725.1 class I SAM-dependent methyltransferase [Anaerolineae bacterium]MBT6063113.1 class I SAM-dependent methyltransferase [Anaerolineae bacterium]
MTSHTSAPLPKREIGFNWHKRYLQQANWTQELREYIFKEIGLNGSSRALEVGCGTGAILSQTKLPVFGLDIELASVKEAKIHTQNRSPLTCGDALSLPYADDSFEIVFCHFLLLWLQKPQEALYEMKRVVKPGGHIIAFAEPDYSRRVDEPATLKNLGEWQIDALRRQGANPNMGAELAELFYGAGIKIIETGVISTSTHEASFDERAIEWETIEADLTGYIPDADIQKMKHLDNAAWEQGERLLYVPTHYLWGKNKV